MSCTMYRSIMVWSGKIKDIISSHLNLVVWISQSTFRALVNSVKNVGLYTYKIQSSAWYLHSFSFIIFSRFSKLQFIFIFERYRFLSSILPRSKCISCKKDRKLSFNHVNWWKSQYTLCRWKTKKTTFGGIHEHILSHCWNDQLSDRFRVWEYFRKG